MYSADIGEHCGMAIGRSEIAATKDGKERSAAKLMKFSVLPPADEMLKIAANPKLMASIASTTKGFSYPLSGLNDLVDELIQRRPHCRCSEMQQKRAAGQCAYASAWRLVGHPVAWERRQYDFPIQGAVIIALSVDRMGITPAMAIAVATVSYMARLG